MAVVVAAALFAAAGVAAGFAARRLLARLRRGALVRPPVCEVAVGLAWAVPGVLWAGGVVRVTWLPVLLGLGWLGVAAAVVDLRHRRLPDALTLPALAVAFVLLVPLGTGAVLRAAAGAVVASVAHAVLHLIAPRAMGAGDVKLAAPLGAVLAAASWAALVLATGLAAMITGLVAVVLVGRGRAGRGSAVSHGPSMLVAAWVVLAGAAAGAGAG